jgi:hypothetical protein
VLDVDELDVDAVELESLLPLVDSFEPLAESLEAESLDAEPVDAESFAPLLPSPDDDALEPLADDFDERESVIYQPLPLKTMPTGWMTLRNVPPHCSQVVRGGSEKL